MGRSLSYQTGFPVLSSFLFNFRLLLKYGADVEVKDDNAFTPLFHAAKHGSVTNLLELFETGKAKPNHIVKDEKGIQKTALCLAKCTETVKILLNFGVKTCNILQPEKSLNTNTMADVTNLAEFLENNSEVTCLW